MEYTVKVSKPSPSMNLQKHTITAATYEIAKSITRDLWSETGQSAFLFTGLTCWYSITRNGLATDTNGPEANEQLTR